MAIISKDFKALTAQELYDLLQLRLDVFVVEQNCLYQDLDNKDQAATHFLYYDNDKLAAYARVLFDEDKNALSIGRVVTAKSYRGKHLATELMQKMLGYLALNHPDEEIVISSQNYISHFYQTFGFQEIGQPYLEDGLPHIKMVKSCLA